MFHLDGTTVAESADADATAAAVTEARGTVTFGHVATCAAPAGVGCGVWQPRMNTGFGAVTDVGTLYWTELYTGDEGGTCTMAKPVGTTDEAASGGLVPISTDPVEDAERPYWTPYVEVADGDAAAATTDGKVRLATLADPFRRAVLGESRHARARVMARC
ncbi:hypothetical protein [Streptomyces virginiae]|uniref:Uncharacterized protein n=1 Tax=Streptomyces virginiae TaxID=1961 RepID=A0ABZ1T690_STRVG|nr:hypothetical protein [Streptomyces virginiae]